MPPGQGTVDQRLHEAEAKLTELESVLPAFHTQQAALLRYRNSRQRATEAMSSLKSAKNQWRRTLNSMGLDENLSPKGVQQISRGFDGLQAARRRLEALITERDQRKRELSALAQRIEILYRQAFADSNLDRQEHQQRLERTERPERSDRQDRTEKRPEQATGKDRNSGKSNKVEAKSTAAQPVAAVRRSRYVLTAINLWLSCSI